MIRKLLMKDRKQIKSIVDKIELFSAEEKDIAIELIDDALDKPEQDYYNVFVYEENQNILGYHCTGKRSLTDGVFDMYWIVVDPDAQGKGVGKKLLLDAEEFVLKKNGRLILAETSSRNDYENTRSFYLKNNYSIIAQIKDFYSIGDNLIIFGKYLIT